MYTWLKIPDVGMRTFYYIFFSFQVYKKLNSIKVKNELLVAHCCGFKFAVRTLKVVICCGEIYPISTAYTVYLATLIIKDKGGI